MKSCSFKPALGMHLYIRKSMHLYLKHTCKYASTWAAPAAAKFVPVYQRAATALVVPVKLQCVQCFAGLASAKHTACQMASLLGIQYHVGVLQGQTHIV
jgi:hypothetical protein